MASGDMPIAKKGVYNNMNHDDTFYSDEDTYYDDLRESHADICHRYTGEFKNGRYHGYGFLVNHEGDQYAGEFKDGKKHGHGQLTLACGDTYIGQWEK